MVCISYDHRCHLQRVIAAAVVVPIKHQFVDLLPPDFSWHELMFVFIIEVFGDFPYLYDHSSSVQKH